MVKLNLTGLQTSDSSETPTGEQAQEVAEIKQPQQETPIEEQPSYSFSLSSLIGNNNSTTSQETTNTTDTTTSIIKDTQIGNQSADIIKIEEQPEVESILSIEGLSGSTNIDNNEEIISIVSEGLTGENEESNTEKNTENIELASEQLENKEFFKGFDVIKEFSEEKGDEIIIGKGETIIDNKLTEDKKEDIESVTIMADSNESIIEESKKDAEIAVIKMEEITNPIMTQAESVNLEITNNNTILEGESITLTNQESITSAEENLIAPINLDIEQTKKELSATRKPFGIKAFSKKSIVASLGAVFVFGLIAVGLSQMDLIGGKTNIQETMVPTIKYVSGTDYTIITNKKKNIKRSHDTLPNNFRNGIGTGQSLNNTGIVLENSGSIDINTLNISTSTTSSGINIGSGNLNNAATGSSSINPESNEKKPEILSTDIGEQQTVNNEDIGIPVIQQTNNPINDMNSIANGAN